jgi:hypothetical protein
MEFAMSLLDRRKVLCGTAAIAMPTVGSAQRASDSPKKAFMKTVVADRLRDERRQEALERKKPRQKPGEVAFVVRIGVPVPFADFDYYYIDGSIQWEPDPRKKYPYVTVDSGFCTDLTSVPQIFWTALPKTGRYAHAAIVHDYLYWTQKTTRKIADEILWEVMMDTKVADLTARAIYQGVRVGGESAWNANTKAKAGGEKRFLVQLPPKGQLVSWQEWRSVKSRFSD